VKSPAQHNILIVDDDKHIRELFLEVIAMGLPEVRVDVASNGMEAVTMFRDLHYKIIVMDVVMPVMNGEQAFREIRKFCTENKKKMPRIIFCTGYDPTSTITSFVQSDERHCLIQKPVSNKMLINMLKQRLEAELGSS
jgi:two-component system, chemotaxis family, chemotaxis protein CheY